MFIPDHKINKCLYSLRDSLTSEFLTYLEHYGNKITQNKRKLAKGAVSCLLLNLYPFYRVGKNYCYVSLHTEVFSKPLIINGRVSRRKVSYKYFRSLLDFLDFECYIDLKKGEVTEYTYTNGYFEITDSVSSKVSVKEKLDKLIKNHVTEWYTDQLVNVMQMKNKDKEVVTFRMNELQREIKGYLDEYNKFSLEHVVEHGETRYDVQMYKVYNNSSFKQGARSFMKNSIQNLSKQERRDLTIGGKSVCVFDYQGFEPSIVYSMEQEVMECGDPYEIEIKGYDENVLRKLAKVCLLIMLNSNSEEEAQKAFDYAVATDFQPKELYMKGKIPTEFIHTKIIRQLLEEKHHLIAHKFYESFGLESMYCGSLINDYVVSYMMQHHKVLVLQTHDEFSCQEEHAPKLKKAMEFAYEHVFGNKENCRIVREK